MSTDNFWLRSRQLRASRRRAIVAGGAFAGSTALFLAGCGGANNNSAGKPATSAATGSVASLSATARPAVAAASTSLASPAARAASPAARAASPSASSGGLAVSGTPPIGSKQLTNAEYLNNAPDFSVAPKPGGTFKRAAGITPPGIDPNKSPSVGSATVYTPVYNRLLRAAYGAELSPYNPWAFKLTSDLVDAYEVQSLDSYTLKLHPGVKYQNVAPVNGRPFTAADAKYSLELFKANPELADALPFERVDVVDPQTLSVKLSKPANYFLASLAENRFVMLAHEIADQDGDFSKHAVGTGPFILDEWTPQVGIKWRKNPDYWRQGLPYLDAIQFDHIPDAAAQRAAFVAGNYDLTADALESTPQAKTFIQTNKDAVILKADSRWGSGIYHIAFNQAGAAYKDPRVRQAISRGVDRKGFGKSVLNDEYHVLGPHPWVDWFDTEPDLGANYQYDPQGAKQLLSAAGVSSLTVPYATSQSLAYVKKFEPFAKEQLSQIGVNWNIQEQDYLTYSSAFFAGKFNDATLGFVPTFPLDPRLSMLLLWHSQSPKNSQHISDPQIDEALMRLTTSASRDDQVKAYHDVWDRLVQTPYVMQIIEPPLIYYHSSKLHNVLFSKLNDPLVGWGGESYEDMWHS